MAKTPKTNPNAGQQPDDEPRRPGRPSTGITTTSFCCRASLALFAAFEHLAEVRGSRPGTELLRAAEDHLVRLYRIIRDDPSSPLLDAEHVPAFLSAAEAFLKEANRWPLPDDAPPKKK